MKLSKTVPPRARDSFAVRIVLWDGFSFDSVLEVKSWRDEGGIKTNESIRVNPAKECDSAQLDMTTSCSIHATSRLHEHRMLYPVGTLWKRAAKESHDSLSPIMF